MLQNPSKYHANPLSHFLALHSSQVAHSPSHALAPPSATAAMHHHHYSQHHLNVQQQQQHNLHHQHHHQSSAFSQQQHDQHTAAAAAAVAIMGSHHHHHHGHHLNSSQLIEAANTTLDTVGKSFTIAAILGLQKSAIENTRNEYNNAINLSINAGNSNESQRDTADTFTDDDDSDKDPQRALLKKSNRNHNDNNNTNKSSSASSSSSFNCDSNIVNRFLPSMNATQTAFAATHPTTLTAAQQQQAAGNGFATGSAGGGATGTSSRAPTALQSLQQLHQQHAQQSTMAFHREKLKTDNSSKKTSLKNKRVRTIFTPEQLERLEAEFERQQYMVGPERLYLAHTLQLTEAQVKVWFQNRRIKWRKHHLEITQQRLALLRQSQLPTTPTAISASNSTVDAVGNNAVARLQMSSGSSIPSFDGDDDDEYNKQNDDELPQLSRNDASDSDLSICNESMDAESMIDGVDEA